MLVRITYPMEFLISNWGQEIRKKETPLHGEPSAGCSSSGGARQPHHRCPMGCGDGSCSTCGFSPRSSPRVCRNTPLSLFCCRLLTVFPGGAPGWGGGLGRVCGRGRGRALSAALQPPRAAAGLGAQGPALCCFAGDQYCGGRLEKPSGSFHTPNWPERDYPAGVTCSWHIVAPKNQVRRYRLAADTAQLPVPAGTHTSGQPGPHAARDTAVAPGWHSGLGSDSEHRHGHAPAIPFLCCTAPVTPGLPQPGHALVHSPQWNPLKHLWLLRLLSQGGFKNY